MSSSSSSSSALAYRWSDDDDDSDDSDEETIVEDDTDPSSSEQQQAVMKENNNSLDRRKLFQVTAPYEPTGDQPQAIAQLIEQLTGDKKQDFSILQGATGTGKTFVMSHIIAKLQKPTLILVHNKTLAAQIARELRTFLSKNSVELFVSYYDMYVPESYIETTDKYIAKKSKVNADIDALRHRATRSLVTRQDVVVVASVSCIYGIGMPTSYIENSILLKVGGDNNDDGDDDANSENGDGLDNIVEQLDRLLYEGVDDNDDNDDVDELERGQYSVQQLSPTTTELTLWLPHEKYPMQLSFLQKQKQDGQHKRDILSSIRVGNARGFTNVTQVRILPAKHHAVSEERLQQACTGIEDELRIRVKELTTDDKHDIAERLQKRVYDDLNMLRETGYCSGIENYSRYFASHRQPGSPPDTLLDYMKYPGNRDWFCIIDESHVALPQLRAMYAADQARKRRLVKFGYRLPSALDNRPLQDCEFWKAVQQTLFVSATPSRHELEMAAPADPIPMIIRPTFVADPEIVVRPKTDQLNDLLMETQLRIAKKERVLAVTLTKRDAEDLSNFLNEQKDVNSTYIHSGLKTHERAECLKALQSGEIDILVGVNLLREGLDLPQVSLVAVLSADVQGFLRSETALTQTIGRAARHKTGMAIFYADRITPGMEKCMDATAARRRKQLAYNELHGCEMRSTQGSSMKTIFDLSKDEIAAEHPLEVVGGRSDGGNVRNMNNVIDGLDKTSLELTGEARSLNNGIITDHIPSSPGCYFWKDENGNILYIGKAAKLRGRVKSYLAPSAKHSRRIQVMLEKAALVEFILTASERDALVLESNLIKHHQPPFNVLLKDDEHYPYICASVGDEYPQLSVVPRQHEGVQANRYRYFGPYTSFKEINSILEGIEEKYDLRSQSFLARHGSGSKSEYKLLFDRVMQEVFGKQSAESLSSLRSEYEEAGLLFESKYNQCRDVVAVTQSTGGRGSISMVVHAVQLREGLVAGRYSYTCQLPSGIADEDDIAEAIQTVLTERHYKSGEDTQNRFPWFPCSILLSHAPTDTKALRKAIRASRSKAESTKGNISVGLAAKQGPRRDVDARALEFARKNAEQVAFENSAENASITSVDGTGAKELANMIGMAKPPSRIECYDVSHTQGLHATGSRVVFIDGRPVPRLYRRFNIKTVEGVDDYASLEEVLERRFRPPLETEAWSLPDLVVIDGGTGQLGAAIRGMVKAGVQPGQHTDHQAPVAVCALAKNEERVFVPGHSNPVNEKADSPGLLLLRSLRDESHRFALRSHRARRSILKSA